LEIKLRIGDINKTGADAILFGVFDDVKKLSDELTAADKALDGEITKLIKQGEIKGKAGEISIIHTMGKVPAGKAVVIGLGKSEDLTADKIRIAIADACRALRKKGVKHIETVLIGAGVNNISPGTAAQAITEGAILGLYTFNRHITKKQEQGEIGELVINDRNPRNKAAAQQGINTGKILAEAANLARDMVNEPSNFMTPTMMAAEARKVAENIAG
jgi:leucyl aminopeptidase